MEIYTGKYSIKYILQHNDNWLNFKNHYALLIRPDVHYNVDKFFLCKTKALGFHQYTHSQCEHTRKVPHTCKSRFCSSCGKIAVGNWDQKSIAQFPDIQYRHIGRKLTSLFFTVQYIGRYTKRPVLAGTRISHYDGNSVTFWYDDKTLQDKVSINLQITDFSKSIIRHIPDKYFKQVRYFGIFANRNRTKLATIIVDRFNKIFIPQGNLSSWRQRMLDQNGIDPLTCLHCKTIMLLSFIVFPPIGDPICVS